MGFVAVFWLGFTLHGILICRPLAFRWDRTLHGHCGNSVVHEIAWSPVNLLADALVVILPLPVVWKLHLPTKKKVRISGMFGLGLTICVVNATRIGLTLTSDAKDWTYALIDVAICTGIEVWLGLIAACLPTLAPILKHLLDRRNDHSSREHQKRGFWHRHSPRLSRHNRGGNWELDKHSQPSEDEESREIHFGRIDEDVVPLKPRNPTFQEEGIRTERVATAGFPRDPSKSAADPQLNAGDIRIRTDILVSTNSNSKVQQ
ncbi:MAG: hypothetical protein Q9172_002038 [Xanthocarpia lactea]